MDTNGEVSRVQDRSRYLYIFLDESGNFDFSGTGTRYFVISSVVKARPFLIVPTLEHLKYDLIETGINIEYFHASEDKQMVRDQVFDAIRHYPTSVRIDSVIVEKRKTGPALRDEAKFYPRMLGYLLRYIVEGDALKGDIDEVIVITDTIPVQSKTRAIEKAIKMTLSNMLPPAMKYRILHHASKSSFGLQVVDYCNWAIFRKWEINDTRSYDLIRSRIRSEFDIFRSGSRYYY